MTDQEKHDEINSKLKGLMGQYEMECAVRYIIGKSIHDKTKLSDTSIFMDEIDRCTAFTLLLGMSELLFYGWMVKRIYKGVYYPGTRLIQKIYERLPWLNE